MSGVPREVIEHHLSVCPNARPVKQKARRQAPEKQDFIVKEVEKLKKASIIKEVVHPTWLANGVVVPKHTGGSRLCIDFTDLNKACPKDPYPPQGSTRSWTPPPAVNSSIFWMPSMVITRSRWRRRTRRRQHFSPLANQRRWPKIGGATTPAARWRSEEHTSELQSLRRISYAVFCFTGRAFGHTAKWCSITSLGTPDISDGVHVNKSEFA